MLLALMKTFSDHFVHWAISSLAPTNLYLASSNLSPMVVDLGELDASLQEALEPPYVGNKHAIVQALLEVKPRLLKLFDVGTRNQDEKKEVESGPPYSYLIARLLLTVCIF